MPIGFFRALLPSWRFFDRAVASPQLFVRVEEGAWRAFDLGPRPWWTPVFAPEANLALAYASAVERLVQELGELALEGEVAADGIERDPRVTGMVSYELVTRIARSVVPAGARFQWKIVVVEHGDYIVSPAIAA